jgi:hypothetical protein
MMTRIYMPNSAERNKSQDETRRGTVDNDLDLTIRFG